MAAKADPTLLIGKSQASTGIMREMHRDAIFILEGNRQS
jgi:hypothetical protein